MPNHRAGKLNLASYQQRENGEGRWAGMPLKLFNKELSHVVGREKLKREEARGPEHWSSGLGQHPKERGKKKKKGTLRNSVSELWADPTSWQLAGPLWEILTRLYS